MIKIVKILITFNLFDINKHIKDKGKKQIIMIIMDY